MPAARIIIKNKLVYRRGRVARPVKAVPLTEIPLSGEMSEGQKGAVSGEEKGYLP